MPGLPEFSIQFVVKIDASSTVMGAVLQQKNQLIAFFSRAFPPCFINGGSAYDKEMCSIVKYSGQLSNGDIIYWAIDSLCLLTMQVCIIY